MRVFLSMATALSMVLVACGGDDAAPSPTPSPTVTPRSTETPTPQVEATPTAPPVPPAAERPDRLVLRPADRAAPVQEPGTYLLDTETLDMWFIGGGGQWSPDGAAMARGYCCLGDGKGVDILEVPSGRVVNAAVEGDVQALAWSPDSQQLALVVVSPGVTWPEGVRRVFLVNRDGSDLRQVLESEQTGWMNLVRWLDDGTLLAREHSGTDPAGPVVRFFRIDLAAGLIDELVAAEPPGSDDPRILGAEASASGDWVAFSGPISPRANQDRGLRVWNATTGELVLVDEAGHGGRWSPDGNLLLFMSLREGEAYPFWRLFDARTGTVSDLPEVGLWAQWLADGRLIDVGWRCPIGAQSGVGGVRDVAVRDLATGRVDALTDTPENPEIEVLVAPDGKRAVFVSGDAKRSLELADIAAGTVVTLVSTRDGDPEAFHAHPGDWSPDGRYLRFSYGFGHGICT